jgi:hypothetical protein
MRVLQTERRLAVFVAGALMLIALLPTPAGADVGQTIILRCTHHESLSGFSQADYRRALNEMSATTEEYSPCGEEIRRAQEATASAHGRGGAPGSSILPGAVAASPSERKSIARAASGGALPVSLGGQIIHPGVVHANIASAFSTLPGPVLAVLAFLLACLLVVGGTFLRRRFRGRRAD